MNQHLHTPDIAVVDPRSFQVRNVGFWRASEQTSPQPRTSRQVFDASGRLYAMTDARLERPATQTIHSLSGLPLFVQSADAAGSTAFQEYALSGAIVQLQRRFLAGPDSPDWPEALSLRDPLLEAEAHFSAFTLGPLGDELVRCDARQNNQYTGYTCAGQKRVVRLQPAGSQALRTMVSEIRYTASGAV